MNGSIFLYQLFFTLLFTYGACRIGSRALTAAVAIQTMLASLFVLKQISLLGFHTTCSDAFTAGSLLSLHLLREHYGKEEAKAAIRVCGLFMAFFIVMSQLHLRFAPSPFDTAQGAYERLLSPSPRLLLASLATFWAVQQFNLRAFGWISRLLPHSLFSVRSSVSLVLSQLLDTLLFSTFGLMGMVAHLGHVIIVSFAVKVAVVLILAPLMEALSRYAPWKMR